MEDPAKEIIPIIQLLCQSPPALQAATIDRYFTPDASFTHPVCRTGSHAYSRTLIHYIYRWYKIMSPQIELSVHSVAFDESARILYVSIHQVFRIWFVPFYRAPVNLTTVLTLSLRPPPPRAGVPHGHDSRKPLYYIAAQNDLYQVNELVKFFSIFRLVWLGVLIGQFVATGFCVLGSWLGVPVTWVEEKAVGRDGVIRRGGSKKTIGGREVLDEVKEDMVKKGYDVVGLLEKTLNHDD